MKKVFIGIALISTFGMFSSCTSGENGAGKGSLVKTTKRTTALSGQEAIKKAEDFVRRQGYTDLKVDHKKTPVTFERGERATDTSYVTDLRHNTILKNAFGAKQHGGSWTVGFEYYHQENNTGRAVTMDTLGVNIIMQPENVRLDWFYEVDPIE